MLERHNPEGRLTQYPVGIGQLIIMLDLSRNWQGKYPVLTACLQQRSGRTVDQGALDSSWSCAAHVIDSQVPNGPYSLPTAAWHRTQA